MAKKAIDIVLLPCQTMTDKAIEINSEMVEKFGEEIVLNKATCLPHISLGMGCIEQDDIGAIGGVLELIAEESVIGVLKVVGAVSSTNSVGEVVSVLEVEKTKQLQSLHETVMNKLSSYLSYEVNKEMIYGSGDVAETTLNWIRNFRENSSFENFSPHITLGYGRADEFEGPAEFVAPTLALCHLGNHCTCRKILAAVELETNQ